MKLLPQPTLSRLWARLSRWPGGNRLFSRLLGRMAPYTGSVRATVLELRDGFCRAELRDRRCVRNHLRSIHAIALMNLGELVTGLAVMHAIDGMGRGIVTELRMEYLKKARGTITATCAVSVPQTSGSHALSVEGELVDSEGDPVARVWATWKLDVY